MLPFMRDFLTAMTAVDGASIAKSAVMGSVIDLVKSNDATLRRDAAAVIQVVIARTPESDLARLFDSIKTKCTGRDVINVDAKCLVQSIFGFFASARSQVISQKIVAFLDAELSKGTETNEAVVASQVARAYIPHIALLAETHAEYSKEFKQFTMLLTNGLKLEKPVVKRAWCFGLCTVIRSMADVKTVADLFKSNAAAIASVITKFGSS